MADKYKICLEPDCGLKIYRKYNSTLWDECKCMKSARSKKLIEKNKSLLAQSHSNEKKVAKKGLKSKKERKPRCNDWTKKRLPDLLKHIRDKFCNPYIRERDKKCFGKCISSDGNIENAGHYFAVGSHGSMRFLIQNIHGQSIYSNKHKHGDLLNYRKGLIERHGLAYVEELEQMELMHNRMSFKWDKFNLILIGKTYKYLFEKNIWIFRQIEFDDYKLRLAKNELT